MVDVDFSDLTDAERLLWDAFPRSEWVDLRDGDATVVDIANSGGGRVIRAQVIRALLLGAAEVKPGWAPGVRLRGAVVKGCLDLMGAAVAWPLTCEHCYFEDEVRLAESSTKTVSITASMLPGFDGTRMRLDGILNLRASVISGEVRLEQARVAGQVCLSEATIGGGAGGAGGGGAGGAGGGAEAIAAHGLVVDGSVECVRLDARGSVSLQASAITGSVDLTDARVISPGARALVMSYAAVGGKLECRRIVVEGETRIHNLRITASLSMSGARLENPAGIALSAGGLSVGGGVFLTEAFTARGEIMLIGAQLGANLSLSGAHLENPNGRALNLDGARVGVIHGEKLTSLGQLSLVGARITGDLNLTGAAAEVQDGRPAMTAERATIDGTLTLVGMSAVGEMNLRTVQVGVRLVLNDSSFTSPTGTACRLSRAQVAADIYCDGMTAVGSLRMAGTSVGGAVFLKQVTLVCPAGLALDAPALAASELILLPAVPIQGMVNLSHGVIGVLRDAPGSWPEQVCLEGLAYRALDPQLPARQRLQWLARDPRGHQPQPYEQLASVYNTIGEPAQARAVLYARQQIERSGKALPHRIWSLLQDITVGYGYRPSRALAWLALLLGTGSIVFSIAPPPALQAGAAPHFNGIVYTLDLLLPVVNLGQKYAFNPGGAEQWLSYVLIAAGWTLATTVAAGAARVLQRG
jgi:hypothetical protein